MNQALHPTIAASLKPFMGSMGMFSNNPVADASEHFNRLADTFTTTVTYLGLEFDVEVNKHSRNVVDLIGPNGYDWFYELSDDAKKNISRLAFAESRQ